VPLKLQHYGNIQICILLLLLLLTIINSEPQLLNEDCNGCVCCLEYVQKYATEAALREQESLNSSSESSLSDFSEDETQEMEL